MNENVGNTKFGNSNLINVVSNPVGNNTKSFTNIADTILEKVDLNTRLTKTKNAYTDNSNSGVVSFEKINNTCAYTKNLNRNYDYTYKSVLTNPYSIPMDYDKSDEDIKICNKDNDTAESPSAVIFSLKRHKITQKLETSKPLCQNNNEGGIKLNNKTFCSGVENDTNNNNNNTNNTNNNNNNNRVNKNKLKFGVPQVIDFDNKLPVLDISNKMHKIFGEKRGSNSYFDESQDFDMDIDTFDTENYITFPVYATNNNDINATKNIKKNMASGSILKDTQSQASFEGGNNNYNDIISRNLNGNHNTSKVSNNDIISHYSLDKKLCDIKMLIYRCFELLGMAHTVNMAVFKIQESKIDNSNNTTIKNSEDIDAILEFLIIYLNILSKTIPKGLKKNRENYASNNDNNGGNNKNCMIIDGENERKRILNDMCVKDLKICSLQKIIDLQKIKLENTVDQVNNLEFDKREIESRTDKKINELKELLEIYKNGLQNQKINSLQLISNLKQDFQINYKNLETNYFNQLNFLQNEKRQLILKNDRLTNNIKNLNNENTELLKSLQSKNVKIEDTNKKIKKLAIQLKEINNQLP
ncbi:uncharacterized protein SCDLUD_000897 [Saccharomycodes ludwigii]|uniref:uncharacterized protein n=1 Tax=Saccharomycodes ludwigii TaxID=36035 RepID=UPI001E886D20|nr:hypothetical protein SCDLUD_000897 [Saccharomycodes ludwigii]KAH3903273.1 hypothetical protein SCDLUD_000897 [Saccharomycodes ludwigii]